MSYILDALKKSDQQRQLGSTPTLLTAQATVSAPRRAKYLLNSVLAVVLICAGIAVGWLRPWQMSQPAPAVEPVASMPAPPAKTAEMIAEPQHDPLVSDPRSAEQPDPLQAVATTKRDTPVHADIRSPSPSPQADMGVQNATGIPSPDRTAPAGTASEEGRKVMALNELPPTIQREIPAITIAFHAYSSKPGERRVMINGNMAKEGELLAAGVSLEQITPDGVILGYKGLRFQQGVR